MKNEDAKRLASLWAAGKLVGGDAHEVATTLLKELERIERDTAQRCAEICAVRVATAYVNDGFDSAYEAGKSVAAKECVAAIRAEFGLKEKP